MIKNENEDENKNKNKDENKNEDEDEISESLLPITWAYTIGRQGSR